MMKLCQMTNDGTRRVASVPKESLSATEKGMPKRGEKKPWRAAAGEHKFRWGCGLRRCEFSPAHRQLLRVKIIST
jgi:hypothetical protein